MKSSSLKKIKKLNNIIKDVRNLFRLKEIDDTTLTDIRNLFRLKKEDQAIKDFNFCKPF